MLGKNLIQAASGAAGGGEVLGIEDVFSTWLYTGNGSTQTITNGIDLAGEGGLVWIKSRSGAGRSHLLYDTNRGTLKRLLTNTGSSETSIADSLTSFSSDGFSIGSFGGHNTTGETHASWTFRKAAKFFDVVTYTGTGSNRTIAHNLGSVPGCIIVKRTDTEGDWQVYHCSLANTEYMVLNSTAAKATGTTRWNSTTPTSTVFSLGTDATVNASGGTYVAYLFAHDAGGFGDAGTDSVIKCGAHTSGIGQIDLGWEPQWVLIKPYTETWNWELYDNMRGLDQSSSARRLVPNLSNAEANGSEIKPNATGFYNGTFGGSYPFIYIAIRRGPMKTPESGTEVFDVNKSTNATAAWTTGFPVDLLFNSVLSSASPYVASRMTGSKPWTRTSSANAEASDVNNYFAFDATTNTMSQTFLQGAGDYLRYSFRRAPGFFDVVAWTGTGSGATTLQHNLGVAPQMIITKARSSLSNWNVYHSSMGATSAVYLNQDAVKSDSSIFWNNIAPTSTTFTGGTNVNFSATFVAYLFATCPGVSKVGSYTGTGTTLSIDCGFTAGARFVLIKRTDSTGDWYVWDTARGIVSGNDSYLLLNSTAAEVTSTDYIDPLSSGFQISSTAPAAINASGGSYIFLAIA
jgi:hypothetical protein